MSNCYMYCGQAKYNSITDERKNELKKDIATYKGYLTEQKDMARKSFKCTSVEYYRKNKIYGIYRKIKYRRRK